MEQPIIETPQKLAFEQEAAAAKTKHTPEKEFLDAVRVFITSINHDLQSPLFVLSSMCSRLSKQWPVIKELCQQALAEKSALIGDEYQQQALQNVIEFGNIGQQQWEIVSSIDDQFDDILKTMRALTTNILEKDDLLTCNSWHCVETTLRLFGFNSPERKLIHHDSKYVFKFMGNEIIFTRVLSKLLYNALAQIKQNQRGEIFIVAEKHDEMNVLRFKNTSGSMPEVDLTYCKFAMQNIGGDIVCHSVADEHAEFLLTFPKILVTEDASKNLATNDKELIMPKVTDLILVDDDQYFSETLKQYLFFDKTVHCFDDPRKFLSEITEYPQATKICIDNNFKNSSDMKGLVIAEKLHALGYTKLYLLSGDYITQKEIPHHLPLKPILKTDIESIKAILSD